MKEIPLFLQGTPGTGLDHSSFPAPAQPDPFATFDSKIRELKSAQAIGLAIWAGINFAGGILFLIIWRNQPFWLHFHAMNASWGLVNSAVAAFLYFHHNSIFKHSLSLLQQMDLQRHVEKMMLLNIGLDVAFIMAGLAIFFYGKTPAPLFPELWNGFGISVMIQGGFLLNLDATFLHLHGKNRKNVYPAWKEAFLQPYI